MSGEPTERDVEALAAEDRVTIIRAANDAWSAGATSVSALIGDLEPTIGRILAERIAQARREGAAEVAERVETDVLSGWQAEAEDSVGTNVVIGVEVVLSSVRAALRSDA